MRLSREAFSIVLIFVLKLNLRVAVLAASPIYTCTVGETAKFLWLRSDREHLKEFRQYRAWKDNITFAKIDNGTQNSSCLNDILKTFCLTKVQFQVWNETHLLLSIKNTTYDDSGDYGVEHVFAGLANNYKGNAVSLKIQAKPTVIPSPRKTPSANKTREHSQTTATPAGISSGVSLTLSVLLYVSLLSLPILFL